MQPPNYLVILAQEGLYLLGQGTPAVQVLAQLQTAHPNFPAQAYTDAMALALEGFAGTANLANFPLGDTLQYAIGPPTVPGQSVDVRVLVTYADAAGNLHYRTQDVEMGYQDTIAQVYADVVAFAELSESAYGWLAVDVQIVPTLYISYNP